MNLTMSLPLTVSACLPHRNRTKQFELALLTRSVLSLRSAIKTRSSSGSQVKKSTPPPDNLSEISDSLSSHFYFIFMVIFYLQCPIFDVRCTHWCSNESGTRGSESSGAGLLIRSATRDFHWVSPTACSSLFPPMCVLLKKIWGTLVFWVRPRSHSTTSGCWFTLT